jgi:hypothetical protein
MGRTVANLVASLEADPVREHLAFSPELADATAKILALSAEESEDREDEIRAVLNDWLAQYQPCLFGRLAAKKGLLSYCVLTDKDLRQRDEVIRDKIQSARTEWTRGGFEGRKSGFIILATSPRIANAAPDETLKELALRLCGLYVIEQEEICPDVVYHDELFLEKPGPRRTAWKWLAGINYFHASGDGRWWQDHRIPAGMAYSVNSVGHMAKSGMLADLSAMMDDRLGAPREPFMTSAVNSLEQALEFAMRTIAKASDAVSGKATELIPLPAGPASPPREGCPVSLPKFLADKDHRHYLGYYHTDITVPSEYFLPDVTRPASIKAQTLDFSYLFDRSVDNPSFTTMGSGRRIRDEGRMAKGVPVEVRIRSNKRLAKALEA